MKKTKISKTIGVVLVFAIIALILLFAFPDQIQKEKTVRVDSIAPNIITGSIILKSDSDFIIGPFQEFARVYSYQDKKTTQTEVSTSTQYPAGKYKIYFKNEMFIRTVNNGSITIINPFAELFLTLFILCALFVAILLKKILSPPN